MTYDKVNFCNLCTMWMFGVFFSLFFCLICQIEFVKFIHSATGMITTKNPNKWFECRENGSQTQQREKKALFIIIRYWNICVYRAQRKNEWMCVYKQTNEMSKPASKRAKSIDEKRPTLTDAHAHQFERVRKRDRHRTTTAAAAMRYCCVCQIYLECFVVTAACLCTLIPRQAHKQPNMSGVYVHGV